MSEANIFKRMGEFLRPARSIPRTPWTSDHRWKLTPLRAFVLVFGLSIFGFGEALLLKAGLGNSPWAVLAQGVTRHTTLNVGEATFLISALVLAIWFPLNEKPGLGTILNMLIIAVTFEIGYDHFPAVNSFILQLIFILGGIALIGIGSGFYITCGLGPGPRDGLMTALHHRTGVRVGRVRLTLEILVFAIGWALGGTVGLGTALFALLIGNSVALSFKLVSKFAN
jgi:uncharacterized membrane protein YczE